jgi:purine-binding chemotaxis protein CheW
MAEAANHYCTFRLAGRLFGFDIRAVKEVNTQTTFAPVPHAPPAVCGYVNLRGNICLVLDLRQLLGLAPAAVTADCRLLIFKPAVGESFGVLVDAIGDIVTLDGDRTEAWRPEEGEPLAAARELVAGIGKLAGELLVIVDAQRLLGTLAADILPSPTLRARGSNLMPPSTEAGARGEKAHRIIKRLLR